MYKSLSTVLIWSSDYRRKFEAKPFKAPTLPYYFATFYDPENNLLQLVGAK